MPFRMKFILSFFVFCLAVPSCAFGKDLPAVSELQQAASLQLKSDPQLRRICVFSKKRVIIAASDEQLVGKRADKNTASMIDKVFSNQAAKTHKPQDSNMDQIVHYVPLFNDEEGVHVLGVLEAVFEFPDYATERERSLRMNSRGNFIGESLKSARRIADELAVFMLKRAEE